MCCTQLAGNTGRKKSPFRHHPTTLSGYIFATKACIDNRKKNLLSSNISSTCAHNMVNSGPLVWIDLTSLFILSVSTESRREMCMLLGHIAVLRMQMRPLSSMVWQSVRWSIGLSVTKVSPAKTADPIEMPFELRTLVGLRKHIWWGPHPPLGRGNFKGEKGRPVVKYSNSAVSCAKTAEPFEMPSGLWIRVGRRKHKFNHIR